MNNVLQKSAESEKSRGHLDPNGFREHVSFHTYIPPKDLAPFLEHFWTLNWNESDTPYYSEQVMHLPQVDIFISADWSGIQGTFRAKKTYTAKGKGRIIGLRFLPGAFHAFWDGDMQALQDSTLDIQEFFPKMSQRTIQTLLELDDHAVIAELITLLRGALPQVDPNISLIGKIIDATDRDRLLSVADIADQFEKSERWLQQLFQTYIGVGLKWLIQRNRLLYAAERIRDSDMPEWVVIAYDAGYSSQQHFISDFKKILGSTPLQYKKTLSK